MKTRERASDYIMTLVCMGIVYIVLVLYHVVGRDCFVLVMASAKVRDLDLTFTEASSTV